MPKCHLLGKQHENVVWDRKAGSCQAWNDCRERIKLGCWRWSRRNTTNWQKKKKKASRLGSKGTDVPLCPSRSLLLWHFITTSHNLKDQFITCTIKILNSSCILCVTDNTHADVHCAVRKAPKKCGSAFVYIFLKFLWTQNMCLQMQTLTKPWSYMNFLVILLWPQILRFHIPFLI